MGRCFLPRDLEELSCAAEREAARRFAELERYMRDAREADPTAECAVGGDVLPLKP